MSSTSIEKAEGDIRYDRMERIIGIEALKNMKKQNVVLAGLGGLGSEVVKNLILMGIQSITIYDPKKITFNDLSSQVYHLFLF